MRAASSTAWLEPLKDLGLKRNVMDSNFTSEDGVFDGVGIPAFTTIMDYTNYDARTRHTNADFYEAVSERDLQQSAIVMAVFAYQSAMRDKPIPRRPAGVPASPRPADGRGDPSGAQRYLPRPSAAVRPHCCISGDKRIRAVRTGSLPAMSSAVGPARRWGGARQLPQEAATAMMESPVEGDGAPRHPLSSSAHHVPG